MLRCLADCHCLRKRGSVPLFLHIGSNTDFWFVSDAANSEQIFRLIQSVSSPKAEPLKMWRGARKAPEAETGRSVIVSKNAAELNAVVVDMIEGAEEAADEKEK